MLEKCRTHLIVFALTVTLMALAACGERTEETPRSAPAHDAGGAMGEMAGMPGMGTPNSVMSVRMSQMTEHMRMMEGMNSDSLAALLPMHRQKAGNVLAEMNQEMMQMKMSGDSAWTALADSVRMDLRTMPGLDSSRLRTLLPAHHARLTRLMRMHADMMKMSGQD